MSHGALHGTACKGCRRRGRKCDRTLPTCLSCERRGVACEGYITRWPGVAARGRLAGKSIPVNDSLVATSQASSSRAKVVLSSSSASNGPGYDTSSGASGLRAARRIVKHDHPCSTFSPEGAPIPVEDDDIERLVDHYIEDLSNIFYLGNGLGDNPTIRYVIPLIDSVPPIRYAIAASASCHMAARASDRALERESLYLRVRATHFLRERLGDPRIATDQATLASILMLAQVDMCSGDCIEFETHLKAAVAIIRGRHHDDGANRYYFEQRLAWLDIISSTSSTRLPNFTPQEIKTALGRFSSASNREWSYDVFPCPIDLFEVLVDVTVLYKAQPDEADVKQEELKQVDHIMGRLSKWEYCQNLSGPRKHMVEAWRFGIMAYLGRLFPSTCRLAGTASLSSQVIQHAELIPPATSWSYSLLWPIFQVGVALDDEAVQEKAWIRSRLETAQGTAGCRHFGNALEALQFVWDNRARCTPPTTGVYGRTIMLG